jgi:hypothetical protein
MSKLNRSDLMSLEEYAERRPAFRAEVMEHKKTRQIALNEHARLYFEDVKTIQYQVQEMLRIEKVFEAAGIQDELDAYNPLIPDGCNWKATFMLEYDDPNERQQKVMELKGIEDKVWVQVEGFDKVYAIADEDLERENEEQTSTVHFLRFELTKPMSAAVGKNAAISMGVDHPAMQCDTGPIDLAIRDSLAADLDKVSIS